MAALANSLSGLLDILWILIFSKTKFIFFIKNLQKYQLKSLNTSTVKKQGSNLRL